MVDFETHLRYKLPITAFSNTETNMKKTEDKRAVAETFSTLPLQQSATEVVAFVYIFRGEFFERVNMEPISPSDFNPNQAAEQLIKRVQALSLDRIYGVGLESRGDGTPSLNGKGFDPPVAI